MTDQAGAHTLGECTRPGVCNCQNMPRCPVCNYTAHDAAYLMDHRLCRGEIPSGTLVEADFSDFGPQEPEARALKACRAAILAAEGK
jgi:hypothetical protein